jgi:hypothetical protein
MSIILYIVLGLLYIASVIECYQVFKRQENISTGDDVFLYLTISLASAWIALPAYYLLKHYFNNKKNDTN